MVDDPTPDPGDDTLVPEGESPHAENAPDAPKDPGPAEDLPGFEEADDFDLELDVHMEGHQEVGTLIARGKKFAAHRADGLALADILKSIVSVIFEIALTRKRPGEWAVHPDVDHFSFASAHIRFIVGDGETIRMEDETSSPSVDAANYVTDLMGADGKVLLTLAQEAGPKGAKAYRQLLKVIADAEDARVGWRGFGRDPVVLDSAKATKNFITLDSEGESKSEDLVVPGHLSMADAKRKQFRLELPSGWPRPSELKRKRNIEGSYEEAVNQAVKDLNLWNSDVISNIRINREREDTVAAPRKPKYELLSVERATAEPEASEDKGGIPGSTQLEVN